MQATRRFVEVDVWKAAAILTIVLIHSVRPRWDPGVSGIEWWLGYMLRFGVPAFCAASGFLYATGAGVDVSKTIARMRRILLPYLTASVCAQIYWVIVGSGPQQGSLWKDFLFAASFGPYYYILVITSFVLLAPVLARLRGTALSGCLLAALVFQAALEAGRVWIGNAFWEIRNPLFWISYFLLGWWLRTHYAAISTRVVRRRLGLTALFGLSAAAAGTLVALTSSAVAVRLGSWFGIFAILGLLFTAGCGRSGVWRPIRVLSDLTYPIYLFHLFAVIPLARYLQTTPGELNAFGLLATWLAGFAASAIVILAGRALLGGRSHDWIGVRRV